MKEEIELFTCDSCGKHFETKKGTGFPYHENWTYLHHLGGKVLRSYAPGIDLDVVTYEIRDKHFCCMKCQEKFIKSEIKEAKKYEDNWDQS